MNKLSHTEYLEQLYNKNILVTPIEEYNGRSCKILHKCICGKEWLVSPNNVLLGKKCPDCKRQVLSQTKIKTVDDYLKELKEKGIEYIPIENYQGANIPINHQCPYGHIWKISPSNILQGRGCHECRTINNIKRHLRSHEEFINKYADRINPNVKMLSKYQGIKKPIECLCLNCGHKYSVSAGSLIAGHGCKKCANILVGERFKKSPEQFEKEFYILHPTAKLLTPYTIANDYVKCECMECGNIWDVTAASLLYQNTDCPICSSSKGERRIFSFLHYNGIDNISQMVYSDLIGLGGGLLSFDFYLPNYNLLIEFQGEQHKFAHSGVFGGEERLKNQQEHDRRKREYAKEHSINLLEIWYYDYDNIEQILTKYLNLNSESVETVILE